MDISQIKPASREVRLEHPATLDEMGLIFLLRSPHDPEVKKAEREWQNAQLRKRSLDITIESFEAAKVKILTAHVEGWRWAEGTTDSIGGDQPEFSREQCMKLIRENAWIRDFLDRETGNASRFYEGSDPA